MAADPTSPSSPTSHAATAEHLAPEDGKIPEPIQPVAGAPVDGSAATFSWHPVPGATRYRIEIGPSPGFDEDEDTVLIDAGFSTHLTVFDMLPEEGTIFYWRLRAGTPEGWLPWSAPQPFEASTDQHVLEYEAAREASRAEAEMRATRDEEAERSSPPFLSGDTPLRRQVLVLGIMLVSFVVLMVLLVDTTLDLRRTPTASPSTRGDATTSTPPTQYEVLDAEAGTYQIPVDQAIDQLARQETEQPTAWQIPE